MKKNPSWNYDRRMRPAVVRPDMEEIKKWWRSTGRAWECRVVSVTCVAVRWMINFCSEILLCNLIS
jgi:hypothetical protein